VKKILKSSTLTRDEENNNKEKKEFKISDMRKNALKRQTVGMKSQMNLAFHLEKGLFDSDFRSPLASS